MSDYDISILRDEAGSARALAFSLQPDAPAGVATPASGILCGARLLEWEIAKGWSQGLWGRCGYGVRPPRKSGCCNAHKVRLWDEAHPRQNRPSQPGLPFDSPPLPIRGLDDPPKDQHGRLKRSCGLILGRLMSGPATGLELIQAGGGVRYGARILELRKRGHRIDADPADEGRGIWVYRLVTE